MPTPILDNDTKIRIVATTRTRLAEYAVLLAALADQTLADPSLMEASRQCQGAWHSLNDALTALNRRPTSTHNRMTE